jgi:hypothetical protein
MDEIVKNVVENGLTELVIVNGLFVELSDEFASLTTISNLKIFRSCIESTKNIPPSVMHLSIVAAQKIVKENIILKDLQLQTLHIASMDFATIDCRIFPKSLTKLSIVNCKLETLINCEYLENLKHLILLKNDLTDLSFFSDSLVDLNISYNNKFKLDNIVGCFKNLEKLTCTNCQIEILDLSDDLFPKLECVNVSCNQISKICALSPSIRILNVGFNILTKIPELSNEIKELIITKNYITKKELLEVSKNYPNIEKFVSDIDDNEVQVHGNCNLKNTHMNNFFNNIGMDLFKEYKNSLRKEPMIDVSYNKEHKIHHRKSIRL